MYVCMNTSQKTRKKEKEKKEFVLYRELPFKLPSEPDLRVIHVSRESPAKREWTRTSSEAIVMKARIREGTQRGHVCRGEEVLLI